MFLAELAKVLLRRWYLVALSVILAGGVGYGLTRVVPPSYSAEAEVLLLPPDTTVGRDGNPYLSLGGLTPAGDVLAKALSDPTTATRLRPLGATADYVVELDSDTPAPLVMVTVEGKTSAATMTTLDVVLDAIPGTLLDVQRAAKVPANAYISSTPITRTQEPTTSIKPMLRAVIVAGGGVLVLCLLLTAAIDALLRRPRSRHSRASHVDTSAPGADPAVADDDLDSPIEPVAEASTATPRPPSIRDRGARPEDQDQTAHETDEVDRDSVRAPSS